MNLKLHKQWSFLIAILAISFSVNAQVYVNVSATGANNGSSWADAYTNLQVALDDSPVGSQIWVAAGTYSPGTDSSDVFNVAIPGQEIYGGFAGTETMLSQRDYVANKTTLSGDVNGDDITDDFTTNRSDNNLHVMYIDDTITNSTIIDGFSIVHGQTEGASGSGNDRRSGGILTYGAPIIRNCEFTQNYGYYASSLYPRGSAANTILVENCNFYKNNARFGGGVYLTAAGTFNNCHFDNNFAERGAGTYSAGSTTTYNNCSFKNLGSADTRGAGIYGSTGIIANNCLFENNIGIWGTSIYATDVTVIDSCEFKNNSAANNGGGLLIAFQSVTTITNSYFEGNSANNGGAVYTQSDSSLLFVDNCDFFGNSATSNGGAIFSLEGPSIDVKNSTFDLNVGDFGAGIAFSSDDDKLVQDRLTVMNSTFKNNIASNQGGAVNVSNIDSVFITNCQITDNIANGAGTGGGISINSRDTLPVYASIMNSTFANNIGLLASNVVTWQEDGELGQVTLVMQNTILYDLLSLNYVVEAGSPLLISNGGNMVSDMVNAALFASTKDANGVDPLFKNLAIQDYSLSGTSPAIDGGVAANAPMVDMNGLARTGDPDIGAIEYSIFINTQKVETIESNVTVFPNPIQENFTLEFNNEWSGNVSIEIVNTLGQTMKTWSMTKNQEQFTEILNISELVTGNYIIVARSENQQVRKLIVKL
jgi:predicted outer membrane repeat protein